MCYVIRETEPDRELFLAIRQATFVELFEEPLGLLLNASERIRLIVFEPHKEEVVQWIR